MIVGVLFKSIQWTGPPFRDDDVRKAYEALAETASEEDTKLVFSTFDLLEDSRLGRHWRYCNSKWELVDGGIEINAVFDRSKTTGENIRSKKNIQNLLKMVNDPELSICCWDKAKTYELFYEFMPKSFLVNDMQEFKKVLPQIKTEKIVLKPRYGMKGAGVIFDSKENIKGIKKDTIVQEFVDNSAGIEELGIRGVHDIRIVTVDGKIDHSYVRAASGGSLLTNVAQGGKKTFISRDNIPGKVNDIMRRIDSKFKRFSPRIYSVDLTYSKEQEPLVLEIESNTGFIYYSGAEDTRKNFLKSIIRCF